MNILFATDIDGTIITSETKVLNGLELLSKPSNFISICTTSRGTSGMSLENYNRFLELSNKVSIIPITTRGLKSYETINFGISFSNALIDSGAILLKDGKIDNFWLEESRNIFKNSKSLFEIGKKYLEDEGYETKTNSEFVIDYLTNEMNEEKQEKVFKTLKKLIGTDFDIFKAGKRGLFATHKKLDKGSNLNRFLSYCSNYSLIVAGDSKADWPMFSFTSQSIGLNDSPATFSFDKYLFQKNGVEFLNFVLDNVEKIIKSTPEICN